MDGRSSPIVLYYKCVFAQIVTMIKGLEKINELIINKVQIEVLLLAACCTYKNEQVNYIKTFGRQHTVGFGGEVKLPSS